MAEPIITKPRIILQIGRKKERRLIEDWLSKSYDVLLPDSRPVSEEDFDLAIVDGRTLRRLQSQIRARRKAEEPVLLPFLLLTVRRLGSFPARHLGKLVDDVIVRPLNGDELQARVANLLRLRALSMELKKEHDRVMRLSVTDDVSGFHNTRYLHRYLDRLLETPTARVEEVSLVFFDLDNFKHVVDAHGHLLGAKVLREAAQAVNRVLDEDDRLVRYGGDEFIVILPRQSKEQAMAKVARMREVLTGTRYLEKEGLDVRLTASFGLAAFPQDAPDKRALLAEADRCLFKGKTSGKDRIIIAETTLEQEVEEAPVVAELEAA